MPRSRVADEPEDVGRDAARRAACRRCDAYCANCGDRPAHRLRVLARVADQREVAVAREADVVELDLVEAEPRRGDGDVDVVLPDALVVGVRSSRARRCCARREPSRRRIASVGALPPRAPGSSKRDDAADQVEPRRVDLAATARRHRSSGFAAPTFRASGHGRRDEADLAVLVLDVELDRVQAGRLQREVLVELAGERRRAPSSRGRRGSLRAAARGWITCVASGTTCVTRSRAARPGPAIARDLRVRRHAAERQPSTTISAISARAAPELPPVASRVRRASARPETS